MCLILVGEMHTVYLPDNYISIYHETHRFSKALQESIYLVMEGKSSHISDLTWFNDEKVDQQKNMSERF